HLARWGNDLYTGKRSYNIVGLRRRWYVVSVTLLTASIAVLLLQGINPSIDFRGGSEFNVTGVSSTAQQPAIDAVASLVPGEVARVSVIGGSAIRVQTSDLGDELTGEVSHALADAYGVAANQVSSSFVGPNWGADVTSKAIRGLV